MSAVVNNTAVKAAILEKLQAICGTMVYNVDAFLQMYALYNAIPLNTTDIATDPNSFIDSAATAQPTPPVASDFITGPATNPGVYAQMTCATLGALLANLNTWFTAPYLMTSTPNSLAILLNQARIMSGKPMV